MTSARSTYTIEWLGYNEAPNFNSIWGMVKMTDGRTFAFWGVKNGRIMFKHHAHEWNLRYQISHRETKGFKKIDPVHYEMLCPNFHEEFEIWLTTAILSDAY